MKQDTKRQLLKVDKEASAAREKAYQDYVMQYEMAVAKQQSEAWRKEGRQLCYYSYSVHQPRVHTGNGVSWSQFEWKTYDTQMTVTFEDSVKVEGISKGMNVING